MMCYEHDDERAAHMFDEAVAVLGEHRLQQAREVFEHLLEYHSDTLSDWNIREFLGICHYYEGDYARAIKYLEQSRLGVERVDENGLNIAQILDFLADAYRLAGDYAQSMRYYEEADPYLSFYRGDDWRVSRYLFHLNRGRCYLYLVKRQEALEEFLRGLKELDQPSVDADEIVRLNLLYYEIGRIYVYEKDADKALEYLSRVDSSRLESSHLPRYHYALMRLAVLRGQFSVVTEEFGKYRELGITEEDKPDAHYWLAVALYNLGRNVEAENYFKEVLASPYSGLWAESATQYLREIREKG